MNAAFDRDYFTDLLVASGFEINTANPIANVWSA
jgi:hypothetical protein